MSYTKAFAKLLRLSYEMQLGQDIQYKRVAIYIGRVFMAERCTPEREKHDPYMPLRSGSIPWVLQLLGHKDEMLLHVIGVSDREWGLIKKAMTEYADASRGSREWVRLRHSWITQLDTLRAFH